MSIIQTKVSCWFSRVIYTVYSFYCRYRFGHNIRLIPLTKFKFAIVDAENFDRLNSFTWYARRGTNTWYATRCKRTGEKTGNTFVWMHNMIVPPPKGLMIDHANQNGLDNRKTNLRFATRSQNMQNRRKWLTPCSSKYKGVIHRNYHNRRKLWNAYINVNRRRIHLGCFMTELEAARAYDVAAKKYHKEFASLNFPETATPSRGCRRS